MAEVTRAELEAAARLLGLEFGQIVTDTSLARIVNVDLLALARAAKLEINYGVQAAAWNSGRKARHLFWPADGTEAECIIKAAAAVQLEREKQ